MALNPGPEIRVERVAQALWRSDRGDQLAAGDVDRQWDWVVQRFSNLAAAYRRLATAAIAALDES